MNQSIEQATNSATVERAVPHVVIIGGGFAGLNAAKALANQPVRITLVDRRNHHLFVPLLYQVATAQLSPANIADPIRHILRHQENLAVLLAEATAIDLDARTVALADGDSLTYDYLILAAGSVDSYFGRDEWRSLATGLHSLEDALTIRRRLLLAFERAEREPNPATRHALLTFVVVGGGPTGVELAGAIGEIAHHTLANDFHHIDPRDTTILLLEGQPRILPTFDEKLASRAVKDLKRFGVTVRTNALVTAIDPVGVHIGDDRIETHTVFWAAGVAAVPLTRTLGEGVELDCGGRVTVERELCLPGRPEVFVVGDAAKSADAEGKPLPGVAPVAVQQGRWAAENITRRLRGDAYRPFRYQDRGSMATIGRNRAVADIRGVKFAGFPAWLAWAGVHIFNLIGFRNRFLVSLQWLFHYITYYRGARLITGEGTGARGQVAGAP
ncbi:MAG: NAD(P)/FAD-dependent oxidoreductase [Chloroflexota bacterium]|nr:NAD(P)/FAD-dependent oxidoreductase [Chloroflexota bacterium]